MPHPRADRQRVALGWWTNFGEQDFQAPLCQAALRGVEAVLISPRALGDATAAAATTELLALAAEQGVERVVALSAVTVQYPAG